jgi:5-carboxymethyl-2-hydroxymuconate isomerase
MPHLAIQYTPNLESKTDMTALCKKLANVITGITDETGKHIFPTGGTRVLAYPAAHFAVADSSRDMAFVYLHFRVMKGRSPAMLLKSGEILSKATHEHFAPILASKDPFLSITFQIDESTEVFDSRHGTIAPLFLK